MCRFTMYLGPPIRLSALLIEPSHSLIRQSVHSLEQRHETFNGDGFGVGWYQPHVDPDPAVFRAITPAWNNRNLRNIARLVSSPCILAHVRSASEGAGVNEANCHPFRFGPYLLMHNGVIGNFSRVRRRLLDSVCDAAFGNVYGSTDTEHFFALVIDELLAARAAGTAEPSLALVLRRAVRRLLDLVDAVGDGVPSLLNVAVADGHHVAVSRIASSDAVAPESLYYYEGELYEPASAGSPARRDREDSPSVVVASERLTDDDRWVAIPRNTILQFDLANGPEVVDAL
jgi:predicted glutamine amidotransferase